LDLKGTRRVQFVLKRELTNEVRSRNYPFKWPLSVRARSSPERCRVAEAKGCWAPGTPITPLDFTKVLIFLRGKMRTFVKSRGEAWMCGWRI
jgi:hypothetical protein